MERPHLVDPLIYGRTRGLLLRLPTVNSAAMNIHVQRFIRVPVFNDLGVHLGVELQSQCI